MWGYTLSAEVELPKLDGKAHTIMLQAPNNSLDDECMYMLAQHLSSGLSDPKVQRFVAASGHMSPKKELEWLEGMAADEYVISWLIFIDDAEMPIGTTSIGLHPKERAGSSGYTCWDKDHWGVGIATTAHKMRTWYAFCELGLIQVKSDVIVGNTGSLRALQNVGYVEVFVDPHTYFVQGQWLAAHRLRMINPAPEAWDAAMKSLKGYGRPEHMTEFSAARTRTQEAIYWTRQHCSEILD